eukprot:CAMPEP_0202891358 /NCGR_PEP_ID=MMETSP1392-20130828/1440_1 /ASSEMBLY_ACC=CAM_ASM_000868 /TAXON_ID=225041 /ORGANISM="Chlamydomonas chlamydogama, Strain SAG 11-48b" /LENGTH=265 /DNA_ID=CAMNT_0049575087 /DNA_START=444 /DNA_END=1237 /DNA_ORIENTATION=+
MAPFLAHDALMRLGVRYKWMLYGDDDTLFYVDNAMKLLQKLNPAVPLAITDNLWYRRDRQPRHPHEDAPRCVSCNTTSHFVETSANLTGAPYVPPRTCGACSVELACMPYKSRRPCVGAGAHGGAGIIFSRALLEQLSTDSVRECMKGKLRMSGSDALLSACLWELGVAFTDPGMWTERGHDMRYILFDNRALRMPREAIDGLTQNNWSPEKEWVLTHMISQHVANRGYPSPHHTGLVMHELVNIQRHALQLLEQYKAEQALLQA